MSNAVIAQHQATEETSNPSLLCECLVMIDMTENKRDVRYCPVSHSANEAVVAACAALLARDNTREVNFGLAQSCDEHN